MAREIKKLVRQFFLLLHYEFKINIKVVTTGDKKLSFEDKQLRSYNRLHIFNAIVIMHKDRNAIGSNVFSFNLLQRFR